ncbi:hypothetical protein GCM10011342_04700 [Aquisalinus flavus]|uniref:Uncharacterized protein n=1 Tax=Aquisalinus flavus TaxID=1526572 RepID=A0A8J2Y4P0_9PROT|nr:hypothetical protein [Aquisalinus flavus]UNE46975.1 hypothetical protein FF099_02340 [Aquisalinus flavus]GGC98815.1 hypothetical protein GCM10011342_04700 [Aquisalinus flavus]
MDIYDQHPDFKYHVNAIGSEGESVVVVDNFLEDADALVESAETLNDWPIRSPFYPGVRAPGEAKYRHTIKQILGPVIYDVFGRQKEPEVEQCAFSLVTTPPDQLVPFQRMPH